MRGSRHDRGSEEGEEWGGMDSDVGPASGADQEEERLHRLTAEFLSSRDPDTPDPKVVRNLYMATFAHIVRHLARDAGDSEFAEDAVHEAFKALQAKLNECGTLPEAPMAFLLAAARNFLRKEGRNRRRHRNIPMDAVEPEHLDLVAIDTRESAREPIEAMESTELKATAYPVVDEFDPTTRKIIKLRRQGKEFAEIARKLGLANEEIARDNFDRAVGRVKAALARKFSSFVTTADQAVRRWIKSRKSALKAIDRLPPPYNKILQLLLVEKMTEKEVAAHLGVSPDEVRRHNERAAEHFQKMYKMTQDELLDVLWHGKGA